MASHPPASLLTLPTELRNAIYMYIFSPDDSSPSNPPLEQPNPIATALRLGPPPPTAIPSPKSDPTPVSALPPSRSSHHLRLLQTCKQIHSEASLLALARTTFHVSGACAQPEDFGLRTRSLSRAQLGAIRTVVLTARISQLRALNEAWQGLPFGDAALRLDVLVVVPTRPDVCAAAYAEIADLSQSHTLAYVFCETLKRLGGVGCVEVRNGGCFNEVVWRLLYRSLVYRMWRWGGGKCGLRFECGECRVGGSEREENQWFRVFLPGGGTGGNEVGEEVVRLVGATGELPDPNLGNGIFST